MEGVIIKELQAVNPLDERGMTYEIYRGLETKQITLCKRKRGTYSGNHYHKGEDPSKNLERFVIIDGTGRLLIYNGISLEENIIKESEIIIGPYILHAIIADTDICFEEQRCTIFDREKTDTYSADSFLEYLDHCKMPINRSLFHKYLKTLKEI